MDPLLAAMTRMPKVTIRQKIELLELVTNFETNNRYSICDPMGQPFLYAMETTGCCTRQCCGRDRPFEIQLVDVSGRTIAQVFRQYTWNPGQCISCSECCRDRIVVECPPGTPMGYVWQEYTCSKLNLSVREATNQTVLYLKGPRFCMFKCPGKAYNIKVMTPDQAHQVGRIRKVWSGLLQEVFTDADNFEVEFAPGMPAHHRVLLIGAALLVDFMLFEGNEKGKARF